MSKNEESLEEGREIPNENFSEQENFSDESHPQDEELYEVESERAQASPSFAFEPKEIFVYQPLLDQLKDELAPRRESACWILGELRYKSANKAISRILTQDKDEFVRLGAAQALEKIGDSWSVQAIIRGLKDPSALVRRVCIYALGRIQDKQAIYPLEQLLKREDEEEIRVLAETALQQIAGKRRKDSSAWERKVFKYLRQIELEPNNANARHNLAVSYFHAKRYREARKCCERARELGANVDWLSGRLAEVEADEPQIGEPDLEENPSSRDEQ